MGSVSDKPAGQKGGARTVSGVMQKVSDPEAQCRAQIEEAPELVVVFHEGSRVYANRAAREALGEEALEQLWEQRGQVRVVRMDMSPRVIEVSSLPLVFAGEIATAVVARDVTLALEQDARELRIDRMEALGTLAAGVASEISDPLTTIVVNVEHVTRRLRAMLATRGTGELAALAEALAHALEGAARLRHVTRNLSTLAHGTVDRQAIVDLRGILESALQTAAHTIRGRARLVRYLRDVPPIEANEGRLGQLFLSLLINAAQSIPEGTASLHEVRVITRTDEQGRAVIEIADTGRGISPDVLPRVFDPFFTTKSGLGCPGLGLSIAHGTVKSMDGDMSVDSEPGRGCIVRITLPAAASYLSTHGTVRSVVLVVDSDLEVAMAIARALGEEHDSVVTDDPTDALRRIGSGERIDAVVCEVAMDSMSGMDFYAEVLRHAPGLASHVVFLTCGALPPKARAFAESLGPRVLEKPPDMNKLRELMRKSVHARRTPSS